MSATDRRRRGSWTRRSPRSSDWKRARAPPERAPPVRLYAERISRPPTLTDRARSPRDTPPTASLSGRLMRPMHDPAAEGRSGAHGQGLAGRDIRLACNERLVGVARPSRPDRSMPDKGNDPGRRVRGVVRQCALVPQESSTSGGPTNPQPDHSAGADRAQRAISPSPSEAEPPPLARPLLGKDESCPGARSARSP